jgi:small membrane protein
MLIQIILIAMAFVLFVFFIRSSHSVRTQAFKRIGFVLFLILNLDAVLRPDDTTWLAHKVGVGRGADLVLYLLVVAFAFFSVNTFLRFRNLERRFTDLARAIALRDAQLPAGGDVVADVPASASASTDAADAAVDASKPRVPAQTQAQAARQGTSEENRDEAPAPETSLTGGSTR